MWKASRQLHELAERITAHKTPLNSGDLSGVFLFLLVVVMTQYSDEAIAQELQAELIRAVARTQDKLGVKFMTVNMDLDIYGDGSKVKFSTIPEHILKPVS